LPKGSHDLRQPIFDWHPPPGPVFQDGNSLACAQSTLLLGKLFNCPLVILEGLCLVLFDQLPWDDPDKIVPHLLCFIREQRDDGSGSAF
jgi:hypothetical protein